MLAERIASVTIAHPCGFAVKIEGVLGSAAVEKVDRALLMGIESVELGGIASALVIMLTVFVTTAGQPFRTLDLAISF